MQPEVLRVAVTAMSHAVKAVTTERGLNAGDFAMVAYDGAGPLHACNITREGNPRRVHPPFTRCFPAFGMLFSDLRYDYVGPGSRGLRIWISAPSKRYIELKRKVSRKSVSATPERIVISRAADMHMSVRNTPSPLIWRRIYSPTRPSRHKGAFRCGYDLRYGTCAPQERSEIVSLRVTVTGMLEKARPPARQTKERGPIAGCAYRRTEGQFGDERLATDTWDRSRLVSGNKIAGRALVEDAPRRRCCTRARADRRRLWQSENLHRERRVMNKTSTAPIPSSPRSSATA